MNPVYLAIQSVIALGVYVTIILNGRDKLYGWLLGAFIQILQATYGLVTNQWGYLLAIIPCMAFIGVFVAKYKERKKPQPIKSAVQALTDQEFEEFLMKWLHKNDMALIPHEVLHNWKAGKGTPWPLI